MKFTAFFWFALGVNALFFAAIGYTVLHFLIKLW